MFHSELLQAHGVSSAFLFIEALDHFVQFFCFKSLFLPGQYLLKSWMHCPVMDEAIYAFIHYMHPIRLHRLVGKVWPAALPLSSKLASQSAFPWLWACLSSRLWAFQVDGVAWQSQRIPMFVLWLGAPPSQSPPNWTTTAFSRLGPAFACLSCQASCHRAFCRLSGQMPAASRTM